jgi:hypothetical protein
LLDGAQELQQEREALLATQAPPLRVANGIEVGSAASVSAVGKHPFSRW